VGILVTFVPPKVTARRGMSDMPPRGTAAAQKPLHSGTSRAHSANRRSQVNRLWVTQNNHPAVCGRHPSKEGNESCTTKIPLPGGAPQSAGAVITLIAMRITPQRQPLTKQNIHKTKNPERR